MSMVDIAELANAAEFSDNIGPSAVREAISQARSIFFNTLHLLSQGKLPIVGCAAGDGGAAKFGRPTVQP
jgi:hypothetical protein